MLAKKNLGRGRGGAPLQDKPVFMIRSSTWPTAKDLGIACAEAERLGLRLPGLALAQRLYASLLKHGHGRDGTQALLLALEDADKYFDKYD